MSTKSNIARVLIAVALMAATLVPLMLACGPNFPNRLLLVGDAAVLSLPNSQFIHELNLVLQGLPKADNPVADHYLEYVNQETDDETDLREALGNDADEKIIQQYANAKSAENIPVGIPSEFDLYMKARFKFDADEIEEARTMWKKLLNFPLELRHYRSVWAAYMLGRSYQKDSPTLAAKWMEQAREFAREGFSDTLGLANTSLSWQARAFLDQKLFKKALGLYIQAAQMNSPTAGMSIALTLRAIAKTDAPLDDILNDISMQRVVTAYLMTHTENLNIDVNENDEEDKTPIDFYQRLLTTLERRNLTDIENADKLAWAAYKSGKFELAARWASLADAQSPIALWIQAKIALRSGDTEEGLKILTHATKFFPVDELRFNEMYLANNYKSTSCYEGHSKTQSIIEGERGVVLLARGQYVDAMDALLRSNYLSDAAYIAERVLTLDELEKYIESHWPASDNISNTCVISYHRWSGQVNAVCKLNYLLSRRLAREGRYRDAEKYSPNQFKSRYVKLGAELEQGLNINLAESIRAKSLWTAAQIIFNEGPELLGTEVNQYDAYYDAPLEEIDISKNRYGDVYWIDKDTTIRQSNSHYGIVTASQDELDRINISLPSSDLNDYFRHYAARLAWEAAKLMPDEDEETAKVLCVAGSWLNEIDNVQALRFYKTLVSRCGQTKLGAQANQLHWFPVAENVPVGSW